MNQSQLTAWAQAVNSQYATQVERTRIARELAYRRTVNNAKTN